MKQVKLFSLLLLSFLISAGSAISQTTDPVDTDKMHRFFTGLEENNRFMGSVVLMKGDEVIFSRAYGFKDQDQTGASTESVYRIGSITKSYTAAMILMLKEEGSLTLDTRLADYFPAMPNADRITIRQMLNHTSGLFNFTNRPDYMEYYTEERSRDQMLGLFETLEPDFEPGEGMNYSNTAFVLLGYIIEEETGMSYSEALESMISGPLGFTATGMGGQEINSADGETDSFTYSGGRWQASPVTNMEIPHGAGAIVSTAEETARFYEALFSGELISEESLEKMTEIQEVFGLGLIRFPFYDQFAYGHNGGIDGFSSSAAWFPESGYSYAILSNGMNYNFNDMLIGFLSIAYGKEYEFPDFTERESISMSEQELRAYVGNYSSEGLPIDIRFFIQGGVLMAQATGQGAFEPTMHDEHTLSFTAAGLEMVFEPKENDLFEEFTLKQGGMEFRFTRADD